MKGLPYHSRPRSIGAQIARMRLWPNFMIVAQTAKIVVWEGPLRGFQQFYRVRITWCPRQMDLPYVQLLDPPLEPREAGKYENIPHLIFDEASPLTSGLCLFDPDGQEWSPNMLIADTTVPWAARWLYFYELWHFDGIWRGGGVGAESVGAARAQAV
jgi:hypothetical protein